MSHPRIPSLRAAGLLLVVSMVGPKLLSFLLTGDPFSFATSSEQQAFEINPVYLGMTLSLVVVTLVFGWQERVGLRRSASLTTGKIGLYATFVLVASGLLYTGFADLTIVSTGLLAANALLIGVGEELLFRGILLAALLPRLGLLRTVAASMFLFAGAHLLSTGLQGAPNLSQFVSTGVGTLPLIALRLRTGSLLVPILFHAAFDFLANAARFNNVESTGALIQYLAVVVLSFWGVRVLLQLRRAEQANVEA